MADKQSEEITVQENKQLPDIEISEVTIKNLIYVVRGQQVMMDSDLAMLYQVETRVLNQAVKRNIARFPEKFRFQLSEEEYDDLKSQFVISSEEDESTHGGRRKLASHPSARKAVQKFKLKDSFDKLADKLNDYVHSNGRLFYNEPYDRLAMNQKTKEKCDEFGKAAIFITVAFLFLAVLINPLLIMSYDYTDSLDFGDIPPEGSQYWVAPFVSDFLNKHKNVLDEKCDSYLREKTEMQI